MRHHTGFALLDIPNMHVVYILDSLYPLTLFLQLGEIDMLRSRFHHEQVCIFDDWYGRGQGKHREEVGGDEIEQTPRIPFSNFQIILLAWIS